MNLLTTLFFGFLILTGFCNGICIEEERQALLELKQGLVDHADRLSSWVASSGECCKWKGVVCRNLTGRVLQLHLSAPTQIVDLYDSVTLQLGGKISPSLLHLKHLSYLNLSTNDFGGIQIPKFFGSLKSLKFLDLSNAGFAGKIPPHLGNLSNLQYLNLRDNDLLHDENLHWLSGLSLLKHLDLSFNNLNKASNWFHFVNTLPSLVQLHLAGSHLPKVQAEAFSSVNLSSLVSLDLSENYFSNSSIINWVFELKNLVNLDLSANNFEGSIPCGLQNLTFLKYLDLSHNYFNSPIPDWLYSFSLLEFLDISYNNLHGHISSAIGEMKFVAILDFSGNIDLQGKIPRSMENLCSLRSVSLFEVNLSQEITDILELFSGCVSNTLESWDLGYSQLFGQLTDQLGNFKSLRQLFLGGNKLTGNLPKSFGQLSNLEVVDISNNYLEGFVFEIHFHNLTKLKYFSGRANSFILKVKSAWVPPFQTQFLFLGDWKLGPRFPQWLCSQKYLRYLGMSGSRISDTFPDWFLKMSSQFIFLNLSHNQIQGQLPNRLHSVLPTGVRAATFPLFFNFSQNFLPVIDLRSNNITGPLPLVSFNLFFLDLSNNGLSGSINHFLCHEMNATMAMQILNLGNNSLSGELPDCWTKWPSLKIIILPKNRFSGKIPSSIGTLRDLKSLHLRKNNLSGEIPFSLRNCIQLQVLDLSENELDGNIPPWIGTSLTKLIILSLRSNKFWGHISHELCALSSLQILDLAHNSLLGRIPKCVGNLSAMEQSLEDSSFLLYVFGRNGYFLENEFVVMKGQLLEYDRILYLVKAMDFSSNNLSGEIPTEMTNLKDLLSLNWSHNFLTGRIPANMGNMRKLESLDLSVNELTGPIPESMSSLTFLSYLNMSDNQLSGKIPTSTQLQSFNASSYSGNKLCGLPLMDKCSAVGTEPSSIQTSGGRGEGHGEEINWFFVSMALGFIVGFWSFLGPLMINRHWRCRYYRFLDEMWWKISDFLCKYCF
ncbi:hypothetical protein SLA2020_091290 [Shorea laevis]